jgi:hypothetical protein
MTDMPMITINGMSVLAVVDSGAPVPPTMMIMPGRAERDR